LFKLLNINLAKKKVSKKWFFINFTISKWVKSGETSQYSIYLEIWMWKLKYFTKMIKRIWESKICVFYVLSHGKLKGEDFEKAKYEMNVSFTQSNTTQGWWSRRLHKVHFFPKSKQSPFRPVEGKHQQTICISFRNKLAHIM